MVSETNTRLQVKISKEIESQKCTTDEIGNDYEYYLRSVRAWIYTKKC